MKMEKKFIPQHQRTVIEPVRQIITSQNSPALAAKIRQASDRIMKKNYQVYKDLENKWKNHLKLFNFYWKIFLTFMQK